MKAINYWIFLCSIETRNSSTKLDTIYVVVNKIESLGKEFPEKLALQKVKKLLSGVIPSVEKINEYQDRFGEIQVDKSSYEKQKTMFRKLTSLEQLKKEGAFFLIVDYENDTFQKTRNRFKQFLHEKIQYEPKDKFLPKEKKKMIVLAKLYPVDDLKIPEEMHTAIYSELQSFGFYYRIFNDRGSYRSIVKGPDYRGAVVAPGSSWFYMTRETVSDFVGGSSEPDMYTHHSIPFLTYEAGIVPNLGEHSDDRFLPKDFYILAVEG